MCRLGIEIEKWFVVCWLIDLLDLEALFFWSRMCMIGKFQFVSIFSSSEQCLQYRPFEVDDISNAN
jgi:hypothetical protein